VSTVFDEALLRQGQKLAELSDDVILEVIGLQLLAVDPPSRALAINGYISVAGMCGEVPGGGEEVQALLPSSLRAMADIVRENRRRAARYLQGLSPQIKDFMCDGGTLKREFAERLEAGELGIKVAAEIVAVVTGIPPVLGSLVITVSAWCCKRGLDRVCVDG